jgi:hypothetical protein
MELTRFWLDGLPGSLNDVSGISSLRDARRYYQKYPCAP